MAAKRSNPDKPWETTKLWDILTNRADGSTLAAFTSQDIAAFLSLGLPKINSILRSAGGPTDYTLHDDRHALRVATRIGDLRSRPGYGPWIFGWSFSCCRTTAGAQRRQPQAYFSESTDRQGFMAMGHLTLKVKWSEVPIRP